MWWEKKFPGATFVNKLIDVLEDIETFKDLVKELRKEKLKGNAEDPTHSRSSLALPNLN